jgi:hypothetical protein
MSIQPIQGRVVSTPSTSSASPTPSRMGNTPPRSQTVYAQNQGGGQQAGPRQYAASYMGGMRTRRQVNPPFNLPGFLGNSDVIIYSWFIAMVIIGFDDWKNHNILPRPSRLWYTSLFYGILALVGVVDVMIPLVNALAIGYTITLLWQYYEKTGQFAND